MTKFRGYGINYFYGSLESFLQNFVKERYGYGVKTNLFIANAPDNFNIVDEKSALGRTVKHLDMEEQKAALYLVANRAYLFSYADNVGVMIENQAIIQLLKDVFDDHWEKSKN
ncbi:hypothetical protein EPO17_02440 [Patescibacteria group bacterium]|nr:MAG: hypothetical protein EPO17_02440 [Patescibacteria group bacterium]